MDEIRKDMILAAHKMAEDSIKLEIPIPSFADMGTSLTVLSDRLKEVEAHLKQLSDYLEKQAEIEVMIQQYVRTILE